MSRHPTSQRHASWGSAAALLSGCAVTLIGVALDLPPMTILLRAVVSGCLMGIVALVFAVTWQMMAPQKEED